jgi:glycosyltransferase involved in cell wall biosynthesis
MYPSLTITIPVYNNIATVSAAIESAINQKFDKSYNIIIVDNGSTDGSSEVLLHYSDRCEIYTHETTIPIWSNHNACLKYSKTKFTLILHADDILNPTALKSFNKALSWCEDTTNTIIWGRSTFYDYYYHLDREGVKLNNTFKGKKAGDTFKFGGLTSSGTLYPSKFLKIGGFLEMPSSYMPSDLFSMLKAVDHNLNFIMCSENILIRSQSSTLDTAQLTQKEYQKYIYDAFLIYLDQLSFSQRKNFIANYYNVPFDKIPNYIGTYLYREISFNFYYYILKSGICNPIKTLKFLKRWLKS